MAWRFTVFDETFREKDLTLEQAERVEDLLGKSWADVHPLRSAKAARRLAAVMYADRTQMPVDEAMTKIGEIKTFAFLEEVDLADADDLPTGYENGLPPEADESSTG